MSDEYKNVPIENEDEVVDDIEEFEELEDYEEEDEEDAEADEGSGKRITPMKAIRLKCLDCCNGSSHEVKLCPATTCPLYNFRRGKNPNINRQMSEEQRQAAAERLKLYRQRKQESEG